MKIRVAIAALAVVGLIGVAATTADAQCKGHDHKTKVEQKSECKPGCAKACCAEKKSECKPGCAKACCAEKKAHAGCKHAHAKEACKPGCKHAHAKEACKPGCKGAQAKTKCTVQEAKACCPEKICDKTKAECTQHIRKHWQDRGWLGIEMNMDGGQPVVTHVVANSPAEGAGFKVGDKLTSLNGIAFHGGNNPALDQITKNGFKVGDTVVYTVDRDREIMSLNVTLGKISDSALSRMIAHHCEHMIHKDDAQVKVIKEVKVEKDS